MKKGALAFLALSLCLSAAAQPEMPGNVILTQRAGVNISYGGPTRAEGRSYNFTPVFYIFPDKKLDKAGAEQLLASLDIQPLLDDNYGTAVVVNPVGNKYDVEADFDAFVKLFNCIAVPATSTWWASARGPRLLTRCWRPGRETRWPES